MKARYNVEANRGQTHMAKRVDRKGRTSLTLVVSLFVFCMLCAAIGLAVLGVYILKWTGVMAGAVDEMGMGAIVMFMSVISLILGWVLVLLLIRIPLNPIHNLILRMNRLAKGDFKARIDGKGIRPFFVYYLALGVITIPHVVRISVQFVKGRP